MGLTQKRASSARLCPLVLIGPAILEQMLVSFSRHPFGARWMAFESTAGALGIVFRVYVQHDPRYRISPGNDTTNE